MESKKTTDHKAIIFEPQKSLAKNTKKTNRPFGHCSRFVIVALLALPVALMGQTKKPSSKENQVLDADKIKARIMQSNSKSPVIHAAKSLMEINNVNQVIALTDKIAQYEKNPGSVFRDGEYVYDTKNPDHEVERYFEDNDPEYTKKYIMVDNLIHAGYLWEFVPDDHNNTVRPALEVLAKKKKVAHPPMPNIDDTNWTIAQALAICNKELNPKGLTLIEVFIEGDSYITALIKKENLENIKQNTKSLGLIIIEYK